MPPPAKKSAARVVVPVVIGIVGLIIGLSIGSAGSGTAAGAATATITVTAPAAGGDKAAPAATTTITTTKTATVKVTEQPKPIATVGDGTWEVGPDIKAGQYKVTVPEDSYGCYWARLKDDSGSLNAIIANDNLEPGAHGVVTIKKGEFFQSKGCGKWELQKKK